jgi:hypothetical protein
LFIWVGVVQKWYLLEGIESGGDGLLIKIDRFQEDGVIGTVIEDRLNWSKTR